MTPEELEKKIEEWDEQVEDGELEDAAKERLFDAGLHLAAVRVLTNWEGGDLAAAVRELQQTLEQIVDDDPEDRLTDAMVRTGLSPVR